MQIGLDIIRAARVLAVSAALAVGGGATAAGASEPRHNAVTAWNDFAARAMAQSEAANVFVVNGITQTRIFAMMHAAVHDALNSITERYARYAIVPDADPCARPEAAVAAAAREVLVRLVADQTAAIETEYSAALAQLPADRCTDAGIAAGLAAANAILALREHDGSAGTGLVYVPGTGPGAYQFTPPFGFAFLPEWGNQTPWGIDLAKHGLPGPDPLDSDAYALDFEYVKAVGHAESAVRTAEQSDIALFWYENSSTGWNRIANGLVRGAHLNLWKSARVLALVNFAMADGFIAGMKEKYDKEFWRPVTAIQNADTDGNPLTVADPEWQPFLLTPPVPDYPSTHTVLGAAASTVLAALFGDDTPFAATSTSLPGVTRRYASLSSAAVENGWSRVYCGIHFQRAVTDGYAQGEAIGRAIAALLPSRE